MEKNQKSKNNNNNKKLGYMEARIQAPLTENRTYYNKNY